MDNLYTKKLKLLYVEDEDSIREFLSHRLAKNVNEIFVAKDGEEGYEKYLETKPDMILTDITMPRLDGIEMSKRIREIDKNIPIIIISAHSDSNFLLRSIEVDISGYLTKPLDKEKLYTVLETNAKMIYMDRVNKEQQKQILEQQKILQNIINAEKHISLVTDFENISFVNTAFLEFFAIDNLSEFVNKNIKVQDLFVENEEYIHKGLIQNHNEVNNQSFGKSFYSLTTSMDETKRIVLLKNKNQELKSFFLSISILDENKNIFLINLTDITKMTIQKNNTEHKAYFDGLTNIYNRNKFDELFNKELLRAKRYKHPLSIAILDIDNFKNFNDTYGHMIGDEILIMLASELSKRVRNSDIFARWGGEEFIILFVETKIEDAIVGSNKLREYISQMKHETAGNVTASFGLSEYKEGDTLESLFKRCDDALYIAKENGRNRTEFIN